jgi:exosortase
VLLKTWAELKQNSVVVLSAITVLIMILIVYWRDISLLINEAMYNESVTHIFFVPILVSYLVYRKRDLIKATFALENLRQRSMGSFLIEAAGLSLCLFALLVYWYGSYTFAPLEYHILSLPLFVSGIVLILFGLKTLTGLIFPILFLLFLMPPPSGITYTAGALIGNFTTQAAYFLLKIFGLPAVLDSTYGAPTIAINTPTDTSMVFAVDLPCSGIYSLIAFTMFATFLAYIIQGSYVKKIGLFLIGFILLQTLNIFRISLIVTIGYWLGEEIAMTIFHAAAGWILIFGGILLLLLVGEKLLHLQIFKASKEMPPCFQCDASLKKQESFCSYCGKFLKNLNSRTVFSRKFLIKFFALVVGLLLVTSTIHTPTFDFTEGLTFADPEVNESIEVFPEFSGYQFKFLYRDVGYEELADQDASLLYAYIPLNTSTSTVYVDIGVADSLTNLHNWEVCYVTAETSQGNQPLVSVLDSRDIQLAENPPTVGHYFVFESPNDYTQISLYWYEKALFNTGLAVEQKFVRLTLIILAANSTAYPMHEKELLTFAQSIAEYWEPLKEQSVFSLSVTLQQLLLVATTLFMGITGTAEYARKQKKEEKNLRIFEQFVPQDEKLIVQTIQKLNSEGSATTRNIADAIEQATGERPVTGKLTNTLYHLQENGLIEIDIMKVNDEIQLVWKSQTGKD